MLSTAEQVFFFFNDTATTEIYTLSLHDALPIFALAYAPFWQGWETLHNVRDRQAIFTVSWLHGLRWLLVVAGVGSEPAQTAARSEEHTLNPSHANISYAVFCLKKKQTIGLPSGL